MKKETCKHKAIAKGKGERYWRCVFCGQKTVSPKIKTTLEQAVREELEKMKKKTDNIGNHREIAERNGYNQAFSDVINKLLELE